MDLSVVTTTYNSGRYSEEFVNRINSIVKNKNYSSEIIIVDDGSSDNSMDLLLKLVKQTNNVKVIELSRNCLLYTSPSPRDGLLSRMPSSA